MCGGALATIALVYAGTLMGGCVAGSDTPSDDEVGAAQQGTAPALASYNVSITDTSVSGLSSGAFFAAQMGVAFSSVIKGVGVVAGGPYDCAGELAYYSCMYQSSPSVSTAISNTKSWSGASIDAYANMANQKIYMFSGTSDTTVATSVMNQLYSYYVTSGSFVPSGNVTFKKDLNTAHTFPTDYDSTGNNACTTAGSPYISNCSFDGAGAILQQIYGTLNARNNGTLGGSFVQFDQSQFIASPNSYGMDTSGWLYVPAACASGAQCKLHVAFHGCQQYYGTIGDKFIKNTGYNKWADTNNIIIMYPQTVADSTNHNPSPSGAGANNNGCWDWVGYYGTDFDRKTGVQMAAVKKMIDRISSGYSGGGADAGTADSGGGSDSGVAIPPSPTGLSVTSTTSSSVALSWSASSGATSYNVYRNGAKVGSATSTSYTDSGLTASTSYTYTVTAVDSAGESGQSSQVTGTTAATAVCFSATNYAHVTAGRAHDSLGTAYANGSNQSMGLDNLFYTTTLKQTGTNYYVIGTCP
jgi:poly(3-hydroxybutyrate) depolymerase